MAPERSEERCRDRSGINREFSTSRARFFQVLRADRTSRNRTW